MNEVTELRGRQTEHAERLIKLETLIERYDKDQRDFVNRYEQDQREARN